MIRKYSVSVAVVVFLMATAAWAEDGPQAGAWSVTMEMSIPGMDMKPPPQTVQTCITPEQAAQKEPPQTADPASGCKMQNFTHAGNEVSGDMVCDGQVKGAGKFHMVYADGQHYSGESEFSASIEGQPAMTFKQTYTAHWVGPACP